MTQSVLSTSRKEGDRKKKKKGKEVQEEERDESRRWGGWGRNRAEVLRLADTFFSSFLGPVSLEQTSSVTLSRASFFQHKGLRDNVCPRGRSGLTFSLLNDLFCNVLG